MMTEVQPRRRLSQAQEDYLKSLYQLGGAGASVGTSQLAERMGVSAASATEMMGKLAGLGLVAHDRYRGTTLTPNGLAVALEMIRHHRLLEMYLTRKLGYTWDEVHDEAELLEHVISERMEERIFLALGRPDVDCHGDPIPTVEGEIASPDYRCLVDAAPGERVTVRRVSDREPGKLRALEKLGLRLGVELDVVAQSEYEGPIVVRVGGRRRQVALGVARAVFVQ
jgi:DtxR family transcriptional regulator, Mn-dependent transcriptional regulator